MREYVATRNRILVTDPKIQRLSKHQLALEYMVSKRRDAEEREFLVKALRTILVNVLGLDIKEHYDAMREHRDVNADTFIPFILVGGNHHLIKPIIDEIKNGVGNVGSDDKVEASNSVADDEYERQANAIMSDMEPYDGDPFAGMTTTDIINKQQAKTLISDTEPTSAFPMPDGTVIIREG